MRIVPAKKKDLGDGFWVQRILPQPRFRSVASFVFLDEMGPARLEAGKGLDVRPHPHIGISTLTYLLEGVIRHRDSLGVVQDILPGEVNWMTAGRGIVHSERTPPAARQQGGSLHGLQAWVALPEGYEECPPDFLHVDAGDVPRWRQDGCEVTLLVGALQVGAEGAKWAGAGAAGPEGTVGLGVAGAASASLDSKGWSSEQPRGSVHRAPVDFPAPLLYAHVDIPCGETWRVSLDPGHELGCYVVEGAVRAVEPAGAGGVQEASVIRAGEMGLATSGASLMLCAAEGAGARVMVLGGQPLDAPRFVFWNFVARSQSRMERAKHDWLHQRFDRVPGEDEFIPLPAS